jgi:hypothetical protein
MKSKKLPIRMTTQIAATVLEVSERRAQDILRDIKKLNKNPLKNFVKLQEFCDYTGVTPEEIADYLDYRL